MLLLTVPVVLAEPRLPAVDLQPVALLQLWGTVYDMDQDVTADATGYGDPEDDPGLAVKRARLGVHATSGPFELGLVGGATKGYDAWDEDHGDFALYTASLGWHHRWFAVEAGLQAVPFSRDNLFAAGDLSFQERGIAAEHQLVERAMGLVVGAHAAGFTGRLGVFNSGDSPFGDENLGKLLVARAEYRVGEGDTASRPGPVEGTGVAVGASGAFEDDVATRTLGGSVDVVVRSGPFSGFVEGSLTHLEPTGTELAEPGVWSTTTRTGLTGEVNVALGRVSPALRASWFQDSAAGTNTQVLAGLLADVGTDVDPALVRLGVGYVLRLEPGVIPNDTVRLWGQVRLGP